MKPRLRDDVHFRPSPGGVFVRVGSAPGPGFTISGRDTYEWLNRIVPYLTGEHTLDELGSSLKEDRRARLQSLVTLLHREGAVRDASEDRPHTLSDEVRQAHAHVIGFIAQTADSPEHRFQLYRESAPVVVGAGLLVAPLVHALLATGVARVRVIVTSERPTDLVGMTRLLTLTLGPEADGRVEVTPEGDTTEGDHAGTKGVLHVSDTPMVARARGLARQCARRQLIFGQATVVGEHGLVGPVGEAGQLSEGWQHELWRLAGGDPATELRDLADGPVSEYLAGPTAAFLASHLGSAFLKTITGLPTDAASQFVHIDLERLRARSRPIAGAATS
jgi:hypothetical protein